MVFRLVSEVSRHTSGLEDVHGATVLTQIPPGTAKLCSLTNNYLNARERSVIPNPKRSDFAEKGLSGGLMPGAFQIDLYPTMSRSEFSQN
ncbi:unnamed protein product, partial [Iphiclides podalirius]